MRIFVNIIYFSETLSYIWCFHMKVSKMHILQMCIYCCLPKWKITGFIMKVFDSFQVKIPDSVHDSDCDFLTIGLFFGGWRVGCSHSSVILAQVCSGRNPCFVKLYDCGIKRRNKLSQYTFDPVGFITGPVLDNYRRVGWQISWVGIGGGGGGVV